MKILFLQLWYDLYGGIETVNDTLASQFVKDGYKASILCLWKKGSGEYIKKKKYNKMILWYYDIMILCGGGIDADMRKNLFPDAEQEL